MSNKFFAVAVMSMSVVMGMSTAQANNDGTVNFTGEIIGTACTVDIGANNTMNVDLGKVSKTVFTGTGTYASATEFDLKVKDCPATGINGITVKFDGTAYASDNSVLALTEEDGVATGIAIELLDKSKNAVPLFADSDSYALEAGKTELTMPMYARYKQVAAAVTAGPANSSVQFTLNYN